MKSFKSTLIKNKLYSLANYQSAINGGSVPHPFSQRNLNDLAKPEALLNKNEREH